MTVLYRVSTKIPEYDVEENVEAFTNKKDAQKHYDDFVKKCKTEHEGESARAYFEKITLADLPKVKLAIAIMSGRGFIAESEEIATFNQY